MTKAAIRSIGWYPLFKYLVYSALTVNVALFLHQDWQSSSHIFGANMRLSNIIEGFAATIDTVAWLALLLMFELETSVISDQKLRAGWQWVLQAVRLVCYGFIVYALYGYLMILLSAHSFGGIEQQSLCDFSSGDYSLLSSPDQFVSISSENCADLRSLSNGDEPILRRADTNVLAPFNMVQQTKRLAWTDVINASCWLAIVLILELDVWLQLRRRFHGRVVRVSTAVKGVCYLTLVGAAVHWGLEGEFLDFWDAFLWIIAFACIEMNLFEWQAETEQQPLPSS